MRILALDVGDKRIGMAVSDPTGTLATPLTTVQRTGPRKDLERVLELARENQAERILVGMPLSLDGLPRQQAQRVREFSDRLAEEATIPVITWDERLTTVEAERRMREVGVSARKRKERLDAAAAAILLQSYLESLRLGLSESTDEQSWR